MAKLEYYVIVCYSFLILVNFTKKNLATLLKTRIERKKCCQHIFVPFSNPQVRRIPIKDLNYDDFLDFARNSSKGIFRFSFSRGKAAFL
jgi:hypothetical protein